MATIVTNQVLPNTAAVVSKEIVKDAPMKFGLKWISAPTPIKVKWIFRFILYGAGFTSIILPMFPEIPQHTSLVIANWALRLIMIAHAASKFFGIDISDILPPGVTIPPSKP